MLGVPISTRYGRKSHQGLGYSPNLAPFLCLNVGIPIFVNVKDASLYGFKQGAKIAKSVIYTSPKISVFAADPTKDLPGMVDMYPAGLKNVDKH